MLPKADWPYASRNDLLKEVQRCHELFAQMRPRLDSLHATLSRYGLRAIPTESEADFAGKVTVLHTLVEEAQGTLWERIRTTITTGKGRATDDSA